MHPSQGLQKDKARFPSQLFFRHSSLTRFCFQFCFIKVYPERTGTDKTGSPWKRRDIMLEDENTSNKICLKMWGEKSNEISPNDVGKTLTVENLEVDTFLSKTYVKSTDMTNLVSNKNISPAKTMMMMISTQNCKWIITHSIYSCLFIHSMHIFIWLPNSQKTRSTNHVKKVRTIYFSQHSNHLHCVNAQQTTDW